MKKQFTHTVMKNVQVDFGKFKKIKIKIRELKNHYTDRLDGYGDKFNKIDGHEITSLMIKRSINLDTLEIIDKG